MLCSIGTTPSPSSTIPDSSEGSVPFQRVSADFLRLAETIYLSCSVDRFALYFRDCVRGDIVMPGISAGVLAARFDVSVERPEEPGVSGDSVRLRYSCDAVLWYIARSSGDRSPYWPGGLPFLDLPRLKGRTITILNNIFL